MAKFDLRILLETVQGQKTSYYSSSFVDTSNNSSGNVVSDITPTLKIGWQQFWNEGGQSEFYTKLNTINYISPPNREFHNKRKLINSLGATLKYYPCKNLCHALHL